MCRKRGLKLKGRLKKGELVQHLIENDAVQLWYVTETFLYHYYLIFAV